MGYYWLPIGVIMTTDQIVSQVVVFLVMMLPVAVIWLRGKAKDKEVRVEAQEIINERFKKVSEDLDQTREKLNLIEVKNAEERGGLNQRIKALEEQLETEKKQGEARSRENYGMISSLQTQLSDLKIIQGELQENARRLTEERDKIFEEMRLNNEELIRLKGEVNRLTERNTELTRLLEEKDRELTEIKTKLEGNK